MCRESRFVPSEARAVARTLGALGTCGAAAVVLACGGGTTPDGPSSAGMGALVSGSAGSAATPTGSTTGTAGSAGGAMTGQASGGSSASTSGAPSSGGSDSGGTSAGAAAGGSATEAGGSGGVAGSGAGERTTGATGGSGGSGTGGTLGSAGSAGAGGSGQVPTLDEVLVFSKTAGFRHDSIETAVAAMVLLGEQNSFDVTATEDAAVFNEASLSAFDVVLFLSTTGDVLDDAQQQAFQAYLRSGGAWVGVHSAASTELDWPWYGDLIGGGAYLVSHPDIQVASMDVEISDHPSTAHLDARFSLEDEWYNFSANPRSVVDVLITLDETSYDPGDNAMGADHPIAWFHEYEGARAWFTALGHRSELYSDPVFLQHVLGGIRWAAGAAP